MSLFEKLKSLFSKHKEKEVEKANIIVSMASQKEEPEEKKAPVVEEKKIETPKEEPKEEKKYIIITEEDKEKLLTVIRPIVKGLNCNYIFTSFADTLCESKTLKTFASLSEDRMTLTINLTQNKVFNHSMYDIIHDHFIYHFQSAIDLKDFGKFEVTCNSNGSIVIRKVS